MPRNSTPFSRSVRTVADDVLGAQRDVLRAGVEVVVEELLDLALLLARRRLVDRELDPAVAVGHDLGHQRRVLGVDDLVVVVDELGEAEDVAVVVDELVHVAEPDVAHAVVDLEQGHASRGARRLLDLAEAGGEDAVVVAPVDERVNDLAVGVDGGPAQHAVFAAVRASAARGTNERHASSSRATPTSRRRRRRRCHARRRRARWTCSAISASGPRAPVTTSVMSFCSSTYEVRSRTPVSSPAYATGVKPHSARK